MASTVGTVTAARIGSDIGPGGFPRTSKSVAPHADVSPEHIQQLEAEIIALKHRYGQEQAAAANLGRTQHRRNSASMSGDSASLDTNPLTPLSQAQISTGSNSPSYTAPVSPDVVMKKTATPATIGGGGGNSPMYSIPVSPDVAVKKETYVVKKEPMTSPTNATKGPGSKSNSSCHQCKSSKPDFQLLFCTNRAKDQQRKRRCRKKYCLACLRRCYPACIPSEPITERSASGMPSWVCPSCSRICICASCSRKGIGGGKDHDASTHGSHSVGCEHGEDDEDDEAIPPSNTKPESRLPPLSIRHSPSHQSSTLLARNLIHLEAHAGRGMNFEALQGQMREQAALGTIVTSQGDAQDRRDSAISPSPSPNHYSSGTQRSTPTSSGSYASSINQFSPRLSAEASQQYLARLQHQQANSLRERMEQEHDYAQASLPRHSSTGHLSALSARRLHSGHDAHSSSHPHLANLPSAVQNGGGSRSVDTSPKLGAREYIAGGGNGARDYHDPIASASPTNHHRLSPSLGNRKRKYGAEGEGPHQHTGSVESTPIASTLLQRSRSRSGGTSSSVSGGEEADADSPPLFGSPRGGGGASSGGEGKGRSRNGSGADRMHLAGDRTSGGPLSARSSGGGSTGGSYEEILDSERKILEIERELKALQAQQMELLQTRELRRYQLLQRKQELQRSVDDLQQGDDAHRSQDGVDDDRYRDSRRRLSNGQRSHGGGGDTNSEVSGSVYGASSTMSVGFDDHPAALQERHSSLPGGHQMMRVNIGSHQHQENNGGNHHNGGLFSPASSSSSAHHYRHDDPFASSTPSGSTSYPQYHPLSSPISVGVESHHNPSQSPEVPLNQLRISVLDSHQQQQQDGSRRSNAFGMKMELPGGELTSPPPPSHMLSPPPPLFSGGLTLGDGTHSPSMPDTGSLFPISPFPFATSTGSPTHTGTMGQSASGNAAPVSASALSSTFLSPISPSAYIRRGSLGTGAAAMDTAFSCVNTPSGGQTMSAGVAAHGGLSGGWTEQFQSFRPSSSTGMTPIESMSTQNSPQPPNAAYVYTPLPSTH